MKIVQKFTEFMNFFAHRISKRFNTEPARNRQSKYSLGNILGSQILFRTVRQDSHRKVFNIYVFLS